MLTLRLKQPPRRLNLPPKVPAQIIPAAKRQQPPKMHPHPILPPLNQTINLADN